MKQTIEIDVPEGMEFVCFAEGSVLSDETGIVQHYTALFKRKEPEFIEVRSCIVRCEGDVLTYRSVQKGFSYTPEHMESSLIFVKWVDKDWRKVEI